MENSAVPQVRTLAILAYIGEKALKNFLGFLPFNPLKRLDSDERIQGNPNKSNPR
jgi:hypothetical protein